MLANPNVLLVVLLTAANLLLLGALRTALRGTTLLAAWNWSLLALGAIGVVEVAARSILRAWPPESLDACRFLAATLALCPGMAVLGAKRPQDRAWKFIVGALWGILILPAARVLLLPSVATLAVHAAQSWFLLVLILLVVINWLPTRFWLSAMGTGAGLVCLLLDYLPLAAPWIRSLVGSLPGDFGVPDSGRRSLIGLACLLVAALWATLQAFRSRSAIRRRSASERAENGRAENGRAENGLTMSGQAADAPRSHLWREFRDLFGAFWALRVAERFNALRGRQHGPLVLGWRRFYNPDAGANAPSLPVDVATGVDQNFHSLLRRFVDRRWIADHTPSDGADVLPTSEAPAGSK